MPGWSDRGTRHERGYGARWVRIRKAILQRDKHLCQPCLRQGTLTTHRKHAPLQVDHIKPKAEGGGDEPDNLQAICIRCHAAKTAEEAARAQGRERRRIAFDAQGRPIWPDDPRQG